MGDRSAPTKMRWLRDELATRRVAAVRLVVARRRVVTTAADSDVYKRQAPLKHGTHLFLLASIMSLRHFGLAIGQSISARHGTHLFLVVSQIGRLVSVLQSFVVKHSTQTLSVESGSVLHCAGVMFLQSAPIRQGTHLLMAVSQVVLPGVVQ